MGIALGQVGPISAQERIQSLDVIRGFAVLGILIMNITVMGMPASASMNPSVYLADASGNLFVWYAQSLLFDGALRGVFSMLFGAGLILFLERLQTRGVGASEVQIVSKRALLLIVLGLFDAAVLLWDGDILWIYGISTFFLLPFWKASNKTLWAAFAIVFFVQISWVVSIENRYIGYHADYVVALELENSGEELTDEQSANIDQWNNIPFWYSSEDDVAASLQKPSMSYQELSSESVAAISGNSVGRFVRLMLLDGLLGMLLGMIAYQNGMLSGRWPLRRVGTVSLLCLVVAIPLRLYNARTIVGDEYSLLSFLAALEFYDVGRLLMACSWVGALLLLAVSPMSRWIRAGLAAVGRLALSNYLLQSAMAAAFFIGFGKLGEYSRAELLIVVAIVWSTCICRSLTWLRKYPIGPMEWLWRKGTY